MSLGRRKGPNLGSLSFMDSDEAIGTRIRELRLLRGLSQRELADRVPDFTARIVMKVEQGVRSVRLAEASGIAEALEVDVEDLLEPAALADYEQLATALRLHVDKMRDVTVGLSVLYRSHRNLEMTLRTTAPLAAESDEVVVDLVETAREVLSQTSRLDEAMTWANLRLQALAAPAGDESSDG